MHGRLRASKGLAHCPHRKRKFTDPAAIVGSADTSAVLIVAATKAALADVALLGVDDDRVRSHLQLWAQNFCASVYATVCAPVAAYGNLKRLPQHHPSPLAA